MQKSNTTTAAASDDEAILAVFERLALAAGRRIMEIFHAGCAVDHKADASPVTEADRASESIILEGLRAAFPSIPCVAEEEAAAGILPADLGEVFFLVDPLDGTKEFVNRSGDFTVNIALVRNGVPEIGVVYAPCSRRFFSGRPGRAEIVELDANDDVRARHAISVRAGVAPLTIVASRSHRTPETDSFIRTDRSGRNRLGRLVAEILPAGQRRGRPLSALRPHDGMGHGGGRRRAARGRRRDRDARRQAADLRQAQPADDADFANPYFIARGGVDQASALPA